MRMPLAVYNAPAETTKWRFSEIEKSKTRGCERPRIDSRGGGSAPPPPRVIFTSCKKILPGNARVQFSRVTLYETAIQQNQAKFNQLIKREAKCKI